MVLWASTNAQPIAESGTEKGWFQERLRSNSMNALFGRSNNDKNDNTVRGKSWAFGGRYRQFIKTTDVVQPSMTYLTLDEHPDSINDAFFIIDPNANNWQDRPASYHNGAAGFSFADGHAEVHKWLSDSSNILFNSPMAVPSLLMPQASVTLPGMVSAFSSFLTAEH